MKTLKDYTQHKHNEIENNSLSKLIFAGEITKEQWDMYVRQKCFVYTLIEQLYPMPTDLQMRSRLENDVAHYDSVLLSNTSTYLDHLASIDQALLPAHIYVHYMGELFGGQILKRMIPHENTTHMNFDNKKECVAFIRDIIDNRHEELTCEANKAFDFMMSIQHDVFASTSTNS